MGKYHSVKQGECFSSLAHRYGFENYRIIYDHPENAELKKKRQNPNMLYPGDIVFIPDNELKEVDAATEQLHKFVLKREKTVFRLVLKDENEEPFANRRFELSIDGMVFPGETDGEGKIEQEINANARQGHIVIYSNGSEDSVPVGVLPLEFGHLDPVHEVSGVQARLNNLGFGCGKVDGILGKKTREALRRLQEKYDLPVTGNPCLLTCDKLSQLHDWQ